MNHRGVRLQNLRDFTVQIRHSRTDVIVGTGIVVDHAGLIISCAHVILGAGVNPYVNSRSPSLWFSVVEKLWGLKARDVSLDPTAAVGVYFPQARSEPKWRRARVKAFFSQHDDDLVLLELLGGPAPILPEQAAVLGSAEGSNRHDFDSYGYRRLDALPAGLAVGTILGPVEGPPGRNVLAEPVQLKSNEINKGMSGAAVLDLERNLVIGIISQAWFPGASPKDRDTAWAIDARVLTLEPFGLQLHAEGLSPEHLVSFTPEERARSVKVAVGNLHDEWIRLDMEQQRRQLADESERRHRRLGQRVVGQHLLDIGDRFRGRVDEQRELGRLLADPSTRVVSVIGRAGIGKTALVSKVLGDLEQNRWPHTHEPVGIDGIAYLSTRTTGVTLERLFLDCAAMLGGDREEALLRVWASPHLGTADKIERLLEALDEGLYVILLDHLEDVLDDQGRFIDADLGNLFARSLAARHGVRLLVTSRAPLALERDLIRFDRRLPIVTGLSLPDGVAILRDLDPNGQLGLRDAPEAQLARAVERLHGLPRALEVLAGIIKDEWPRELDEVLHGFLEEEEAVDALIREGFGRLAPDERLIVDALAILGRPVPLVAVKSMLAPLAPELNVDAILRRLIDIYMVNADRASKTVALNPIDRDHAYINLLEEGAYSKSALERRAADYYARLRVPREGWRSVVDIEPHLLEFGHRFRAGDYGDAAEVLAQIDVGFVAWRGYTRRIQTMLRQLDGKLHDPRLLMLHAYGLGQTYVFLGPLEKAIELLTVARATAREIGDREIGWKATGNLGEARRRLGRVDEAIVCFEEAERMMGPDVPPRDRFLLGLSLTYSYARQFANAVDRGQRLMALALALGDNEAQAQAHDALSLACLGMERVDEALDHAGRAIALYQELDARDPLGYVLNVQGMAYVSQGRLPEAVACFEQGLVRGRDDDNPRLEGFCLFNLARVRRSQSDLTGAVEAADAARLIFERMGAVEARAATALVEAIRAAQASDCVREARSLLACARASRYAADLQSPVELLAEAEAAAQALGLSELLEEAKAIRRAWTDHSG